MTLYELTAEMRKFLSALEEGTLTDEELARNVAEIKLPFEQKADNIACMIKNLTAEAEAIKTERDALTERYQQKKNKADWLKEYLSESMQLLDLDSLETARNRVSFRSSQQIHINDIEAFKASEAGKNFLRYKEPEVDKTKLKEAIKNGMTIDGVELVVNRNIQIK